MSLVKKYIFENNAEVAVWKVDETEQEYEKYLQYLTEECQLEYHQIKTAKRKKEFLFSRYLITLMRGRSYCVNYDEYGAPSLNDCFLSISHCDAYIAVGIAGIPIGIDIQILNPKIGRIANKFMNEAEWNFITDSESLLFQTLIWSAKEAMYKLDAKGSLIFKSQLLMSAFTIAAEIQIQGEIQKGNISHNCMLEMRHTETYNMVIASYNER